ncbi:unnamed protein product [Mycena citricolor]|uniref:Uncharacterized protein n=1 Tax=Mycena citricolor TaxID=2018698 RepID=A0AAD2GUP6_9AGAR|nr:unnamed protein product [Mycena citricolor]
MKSGHLILLSSTVFFCFNLYAILLSRLLPLTGVPVANILDSLARDDHYKYFALFLIPTTAYFVIANWVGWQYYQNS